MDYLVKIRSVQTPPNGQFSIGADMADWHLVAGIYRQDSTHSSL
jgi:hypothetical protein